MRPLDPHHDPTIERLRQANLDARRASCELNLLMWVEAYNLVDPFIGPLGEPTDYNSMVTAPLELYDKCRKLPGVNMDRAIKMCGLVSREIAQSRLEGVDEAVFEVQEDRRPTFADFEELLERYKQGAMTGDEEKRFYKALIGFVADFQTEKGSKLEIRHSDDVDKLPKSRLVDVIHEILSLPETEPELKVSDPDIDDI